MGENEYQRNLLRLQEEQKRALQETDTQINQWLKFESDYEALHKSLVSLPDSVSHDVMVPFGKMAFMPGQLVHTNEILVLLGDNWFAERSAKQAAEIVERRLITVKKHIEDLTKQRQLLEPRQQFTEELEQLSKEGGEMYDIREEYDEEKEKKWKEAHKKHVEEYRTKLKRESKQETSPVPPSEEQTALTDEELWARLDQLEEIEEERREMDKIGTKAEDRLKGYKYPNFPAVDKYPANTAPDRTDKYPANTAPDRTDKYPANTAPDRTDELSSSEDDESSYTASDELDSDDDDDGQQWEKEDYSREITSKGTLINFSHSKGSAEPVPSTTSDISSPGDIYTTYLKTIQPKSILKKSPAEPKRKVKHKTKKTVVAFDTGSDDGGENRMEKAGHQIQVEKAFSSKVIEKSPTELSTFSAPQPLALQQPESKFKSQSANNNVVEETTITKASSHTVVQENVKPVSKFKSKRQNVQR